jgi:hypothetical protein
MSKRASPASNFEVDHEYDDHSDDSSPQLSVQQKYQIVCLIWRMYDLANDKYPRNCYQEVADTMHVSPSTVKSIWKDYSQQLNRGISVPDLTPKPHGHAPRKLTKQKAQKLRDINDEKQGFIRYREMSVLSDIPLSTLHRYFNYMGATQITSHIKPLLTMRHKLNRILYVLHQIDNPREVERILKLLSDNETFVFHFKSFFNWVWIDEVWFFLKQLKERRFKFPPTEPWYYSHELGQWVSSVSDSESSSTSHRLFPPSEYPADTITHKNHIPKVMFLLAIGEPHRIRKNSQSGDVKGNSTSSSFQPKTSVSPSDEHLEFSNGLIGIWPFVEYVPAKKKSKNRAKGTLEAKSVSVTGRVFADKMLESPSGVMSTIIAKLKSYAVGENCIGVRIGLDNALPHQKKITLNEITSAGISGDRNIKLFFQPSQSPDCNVNDLAFISSLKARVMQFKHNSKSIDEFIENVVSEFKSYDVNKLSRITGLEYVVFRQILEHNGGNQFKIQHTKIRSRQKTGIAGGYAEATGADQSVNSSLILKAISFYNENSETPFSWKTHPDYFNQSSESEFQANQHEILLPDAYVERDTQTGGEEEDGDLDDDRSDFGSDEEVDIDD